MSIATLNKYKKLLKDRLNRDKTMIKRYQGVIAETAASILDYEDQIEDINNAITVLKMHLKRKK